MATAGSYGSHVRTDWNAEALKNLHSLSPRVQKHLQKVYLTLAGALFVSTVGIFFDLVFHVGGLLSTLGFLGAAFWLNGTPAVPSLEGKRLKLFALAAFLQGLSVGPLVNLALAVNSGAIATALLITGVVFACFSGAAILAKRREFLFLGGIISSAVSAMVMMRLAMHLFGASAGAFQLELYGGLVVFVGYILFDTQMIIERASLGDFDYVRHAMDLLLDFVSVFVRVLVILLKDKSSSEKERRKRNYRK